MELGVELTMDLYPFYPPIVKVIRPRLKGFMMGRVSILLFVLMAFANISLSSIGDEYGDFEIKLLGSW